MGLQKTTRITNGRLLQDIPMDTLCLVQAVRQRYSSIAAACSADMATHKPHRTNCVESIRHMVKLMPITLHFELKKLLTNSSKKYEGILLIFKHH